MPRMARRRLLRLAGLLVALLALAAALEAGGSAGEPLHVFLRAGPKTHGPGQHDHPRFLEEWRALLGERGAVVDGALAFPTAAQLDAADVLVLYAAEGATIEGDERERLERFLARGGGIVVLHDAVCGTDPHWFETIAGGAWEHGHSKWLEGPMGLYLVPQEHPITRGIPSFEIDDELYWDLHLVDGVQVLANGFRTVFDIEPQMWTYEPGPYRAFVSIQGHNHTSFSHPAWRAMVLRGIAWVGRRDADLFLTPDELAGLAYPPGGPTPPERAHETFRLHPDLEIELVAGEPAVVNPISIDWDARGRAWVACTPGYPEKEEFSRVPAHDRVVILDGRGRVASVFADGLDLVTSVLVHERGVIVTAAPEILYLEDTDGDDRADRRTVLYRGFGYGDTHAVISNLRWGLDGWVYGTQGYSGSASKHVVGADGVDHGSIPNGLFRFRPDGSAIELVSSYGSNTWGLDFAPDGELFFSMANGSHVRHVVLEEAVLADARVGGVDSWTSIADHDRAFPIVEGKTGTRNEQIDFVGGFTAAAGCLVLDAAGWPAEFAGDHFVCEPTLNLVHRDRLVADGVTFRAEKPREEEFLASSDSWFRPVHLRTGPDGALYVLDFYNQAVIHNDTRGPRHGPTNAAVRPDRDRWHGRIWRIRPRGAPARTARAVEGAPAELGDPDAWVRATALRLLRERGAGLGGLDASALPPAGRIAALWLEPAAPAVLAALTDPDAGVRANAARLAGGHARDPAVVAALVERACADEAPRVRLRALVALAGASLDEAQVEALAALAPLGPGDDWTRSAQVRALLPHAPIAIRLAGPVNPGNAGSGTPLLVELGRQVARGRDPGRVDEVLVALAACGAPPETLEAALGALDGALGAGFAFHRAGIAGRDALGALLAHDDLRVAMAALPLVARREGEDDALDGFVAALGERLLGRLADDEAPLVESLAVLPALLSVEAFRGAAIAETPDFLRSYAPLDVQLAAIAALSTVDDPGAAAVLCGALSELGASAAEAAFEALLARAANARTLLDAVDGGEVPRRLLGARREHRLRSFPDAAVAERARAVLTAEASPVAERLAALLPAVGAPGDVVRGEELFARECGVCHLFEGEGASVGPDLTGMGAHGVEKLLGVVLDPNAEVDPAYVEYVARTLDGVLHTGIVVRETREAIVLRNTGGDVELARADLDELYSSGLSLMPAGLEAMGPEALRDLLAFLTDDYRGWRVLDLRPYANASSLGGLFDPDEWSGWGRFQRFGVLPIDGIPFDVRDPALVPSGKNVLVLNGGANPGWACRTSYARRIEVPVGCAVARVHVLGGVAGWGTPWDDRSGEPVVRWTWRYADGASEEVVLTNGVELADWIGRYDVPGSTAVEGLLAPDAPGQVRRFALAPSRPAAVRSIVLESEGNHVAPVFLALTAELPGAEPLALAASRAAPRERVEADCLLLGGGSSHDFGRWFGEEDAAVLRAAGRTPFYTEDPAVLLASLDPDDVLVLSTNRPLPEDVRERIGEHVRAGGGLVALHPGTWANWPEWTAMGSELLGAQATSHEELRGFTVEVTRPDHPIVAGVEARFAIEDELYRAAPVPEGAPIEVLADGRGDARYPVLWTCGRVVGLTLGHDGRAHEHPAFRRLLTQAVEWAGR